MKVRKGFVSNSSTSSFCIYGIQADSEMLAKAVKILDPESELVEDGGYGEYVTSEWEAGDVVSNKTNLEYHQAYCEYNYFGRSWSGIGDDETGKQFKDSVEKEIKSLFGEDVKCFTIEEAWRDG